MKLTRRRVLVGLGGTVLALPFLDSLEWLLGGRRKRPARADDGRPRFFAVVRAGNGVQQEYDTEPERFWPSAAGPLTVAGLTADSGRALSELGAYGDRVLAVRGVNRPFSTPSCGHAESLPQVLTAAQNTGGDGNDPLALGMSADWRIANQLNPAGRGPMVLMAGPSSTYIGEGLSWRTSGDRTPAERSPKNQYMRMMGLSGAPPEIQQRIADRRMSVNDLVRGELNAILAHPDLSSFDRQRLQQHLESIRDTELSVMSCGLDPAATAAVNAISDPEANDVRPEVVRRHMDVIALAFQCGYTHSATLQIGEGNDQTIYTIDGVEYPRFHWISHRIYSDGADGDPIPNAVDLHHNVDRFQMQMFAYLLERLDAIDSAVGGRLLDDCAAVWTNDLADGPPHGGRNVPWIIAGGCGGKLRTGQFVDLAGVKTNKLLNSLLTAMGCTKPDGSPVDDFGDSGLEGGLIPEILV